MTSVNGMACQVANRERSLKEYEHIVATSRDLMSLIDREYVYKTVNEAYLQAHQRLQHEIIGKTIADLMSPKVFDSTIKPMLEKCFTGEIAHDFNNLLMGIQGHTTLMMREAEMNAPRNERLLKIEAIIKSGANLLVSSHECAGRIDLGCQPSTDDGNATDDGTQPASRAFSKCFGFFSARRADMRFCF